ncbi:hypothetical protein ACFE04_017185 [Oxalis oulophora]
MSITDSSIELPILDVSQPLNESMSSFLAESCIKWGFFLITNHGVSKDLYDRIELMQEYCTKMTELSNKIIEVLLMCLGKSFGSKFLESEFNNCHGYLRIINYSPPEKLDNEVEGLGKHTDISCITVLYPDQIGELQVKSMEGNWTVVKPREGALVVNIGDMLQAWSNDRLRSSEHRVVLNQPVNRFSLAFFWCFEDQKVIYAPDEVVGERNRRIYEPFLCLDYTKFRENYVKGKFEKVGHTVKDFAGTLKICM